MSNTHFSDLRSASADYSSVRKIVHDRMGRRWCLFIDRDGVINRQIVGGYVRSWADFEWLPGSVPALSALLDWAPYVVVATNQQGIGKGLMSSDDVSEIHRHVRAETVRNGLEINDFQVCPHLESDHCYCRKPSPGLLLDWLHHHPEVDPALSVMVGDSASDLELARNLAAVTGGCVGVHIGPSEGLDEVADESFNSLQEFTSAVISAMKELR
ncbi:HAD family hydrolase [Mycobacterium sp. CBMA293]|nr:MULTISPECIES: HAD family hydrolase [unclassified Mycolicibacterium]MUL59320.1 HAD family hydrolase [Mycolicibacterium sp. CBMA 335]MUL71045.1 HAD family hydrolase [Mycolicibacterium sp. CBMA 311]MUM11808.1 HAD family hydrolase [Mycolicibacterium sp. CBMA 293]MUL47833.1 HAD family hydrolase [Mycolicibacterium sp. CBMA 360]MUL94688.1 HAD family hydrolase [Mycolicibacterium sp. CBMA 230]